jgi:hypothetical protein
MLRHSFLLIERAGIIVHLLLFTITIVTQIVIQTIEEGRLSSAR